MRPFTQTILHEPAKGLAGNCFATCLRCLLELEDPDAVPNFAAHGELWWKQVQAWLAPIGLAYLELTMPKGNYQWEAQGYHIITGASPRNVRHSVVGFRGKVCWDPYPHGGGLIGDPNEWVHGFLVMTATRPKEHARKTQESMAAPQTADLP